MSGISAPNTALTQSQIERFFKFHNTEIHVVDLEKLKEQEAYELEVIYTGSEANEFNNGNPHHWLIKYGSTVFDSYGARDYKIPEHLHFATHKPKDLQSYGTNVCGEYSCLIGLFYSDNPDIEEEEVAQEFVSEFNLTTDTKANDEIILECFKKASPPGEFEA